LKGVVTDGDGNAYCGQKQFVEKRTVQIMNTCNRELVTAQDNLGLALAVDLALLYLTKQCAPSHCLRRRNLPAM
jgi:hypothetical protein